VLTVGAVVLAAGTLFERALGLHARERHGRVGVVHVAAVEEAKLHVLGVDGGVERGVPRRKNVRVL